jgi:translocation and assembly module TamB
VTPLRFDVQLIVPSTLRIDTSLVRMVANADLNLRGTYDKPVLLGHADVERGEVTFEGRRYRVTHGTIDFTNPTRIEPFFDVSAETTVRVPGQSQSGQTYGQTYRVTVSVAGTVERMVPTFGSDPPLPSADVLALLFGDSRRTQDAELRALQSPNTPQTDILTARATQALTSPISSEVSKVVQQTFGIDTFQLSPSLVDPTSQQTGRVSPTVGLTVAKRISDRAYLTYSRSLNSAQYDQVILLEYDATDRLSWLLSRNEDQTFALEFRVRRAF